MRLLFIVGFLVIAGPAQAQDRIDIKLDSSEASRVLSILDRRALHQPVSEQDWRTLFATTPYRRLKEREASLRRDFTDEDFRQFVGSLDARRTELRRTLDAWTHADLRAAAERSLRYLPAEARIRVSVYPMIKPKRLPVFSQEILTAVAGRSGS